MSTVARAVKREVSAYVVAAAKYARAVVAGRIPACRYVQLACERHVVGLRRQRRRAYPFKLDHVKATRVCRFIELLPHVKGVWAQDRKRIKLEPWQCFILVNVFGWVRKRDHLRRYRRVYLEVPRKNAKSTTSAGVGDYMFAADDEFGAEVYSGATTEKQAWEVYRPARLMALKTPEFLEAFGVQVGAKNMHILENGSRFEPIIGKPGDGASPSCWIIDEFHEHATNDQYSTALTGMGARKQPLLWVITTAGNDTAGPCYRLRQEMVEVLEGKVENDELFGMIYTIDLSRGDGDPGDDWTDPDVLRKANPNYGVSVFAEYLRRQQLDAINDPAKQIDFKTKHLNLWGGAAAPYFNAEKWARLGDSGLHATDFRGEDCFVGLDLASKIDLTCSLRVFRRIQPTPVRCPRCRKPDGTDLSVPDCDCGGSGVRVVELPHYYVFPRFYLPEARTLKPELRNYADWAARGYLTASPGDMTDYDAIELDLKADSEAHGITQLGADPHNATQLLTHLQGVIGADNVVEVPQNVTQLSEPMKEIQGLIEAGRIHHDGNPVMAWCVGNVTARPDRNENVFPRKESEEKKIDGAVALIIAINRALGNPADAPKKGKRVGIYVPG